MLIPLIVAAALMNAAMGAASAISTILIADEVAPGLAGLPNTAGVLGTAAGAVAVGRWTSRWGRASALRAGYLAAVAGGGLTVLASTTGPVGWLFPGMLLLGAGNAAALLSRYAAADGAAPARRAAAMSTVVWAGTVGAVGGPFLFEPAEAAALAVGLPALSGPFLLATAATVGAVAAAARIRPAHSVEVICPAQPVEVLPSTAVEVKPHFAATRRTTAVAAAAVMLVGQLVMVAMMTSVPVHVHQHGQGLAALGLMLSAHTFGMFAFSPVTGWWIDKAGPRPVMVVGLAVLAFSSVAVAGPGGGHTLTPALLLLGYGWNLCYLGGSALLVRTAASTPAAQARLESTVEAWVWGVSALATAGSTWLFARGGFPLLATVGTCLALPLLVVVVSRRVVPADRTGPELARQTCG